MCLPEVGQFLQIIASHQRGLIGEIGTACGVGAAWIASGMQKGTRLITVELKPERAALASRLFAEREDVTVICGDAHEISKFGPFDMLFTDGGGYKTVDETLELVRKGGFLIKDDLTPEASWTAEERQKWGSTGDDSRRREWLQNPKLLAQELALAPRISVFLASKL
jgi:predicted O-methyltransferase YrrM